MTAAPDILGDVSDENVEVVRRVQDAFNRGDLDELLGYMSPDTEWQISENNPAARTLHGRDELRAYLEDWRDTVHGLYYEVSRCIDAGDAVMQEGTISGHAGHGGPELTVPLALVTYFEDGVPVRTEEYLDVAQAHAAAGIA